MYDEIKEPKRRGLTPPGHPPGDRPRRALLNDATQIPTWSAQGRREDAALTGPQADRLAGEAGTVPARLAIGAANDPSERAAEQAAPGTAARDAVPESAGAADAPPAVHQALQSPGRPLETETRADLEGALGQDLGRVRVHTGAHAGRSTGAIGARAYTVGQHIVFGPGQYAPSTQAGRGLLIHELAHTGQQNTPAGVVRRVVTDLASIPVAERRAVTVSNIPVDIPTTELQGMFSAPSQAGGASVSYSSGATEVFGPGVPTTPARLRSGLASVGGYLAGQTNALLVNSTITVALDLTPYGSTNSLYRFTRFTHTENNVASEVLLIELVGATAAAPAPVAVVTGPFQLRGRSFTLGVGWTDERFALLRQAISLLPDAALPEVDGLTFDCRGQGTVDEAGHYDREHDRIEMHLNAFPTTSARSGDVQIAVRLILHELGHALDSRRLERAWRTFDQAGQTAAAQRTLLAARSVSGMRWRAPTSAGGTFEIVDAATTIRGNAFRTAAQQDGATAAQSGAVTGGITSYANTNWEEYFAESFSIYVSAPELLHQLRPHVYAFFVGQFPLPAPQGGAAAPRGARP